MSRRGVVKVGVVGVGLAACWWILGPEARRELEGVRPTRALTPRAEVPVDLLPVAEGEARAPEHVEPEGEPTPRATADSEWPPYLDPLDAEPTPGSGSLEDALDPVDPAPLWSADTPRAAGAEDAPEQVIVLFEPGAPLPRHGDGIAGRGRWDMSMIEANHAGWSERGPAVFDQLALYVADPGVSAEAALALVSTVPHVVEAELDGPVYADFRPDDPRFDEQWHLFGPRRRSDINAVSGWELERGSKDVVVAVVDSGIDRDHDDLRPNIWRNADEVFGNGIDDDGNGYRDDTWGYDFHNNDRDPRDDRGHGTHVAGIIGARGNNGRGVSGVCHRVSLMAIKTLGDDGSGKRSNSIRGLQYAINNGADVINCSWSSSSSSMLARVIDAATDRGILVFAAAGNTGKAERRYPAATPGVIAVSALQQNGRLASFSTRGDHIDLAAPGVGILSTYPGQRYIKASGTSMASPVAAGSAALLLASNPTLTRDQVIRALENRARLRYGNRQVDVLEALQAVARPSRPRFKAPAADARIPTHLPWIAWNEVAGAKSYQLRITRLGDQTVVRNLTLERRWYRERTGLAPGRYRAQVRGIKGNGVRGLWRKVEFRLTRRDTVAPPAPQPQSPTGRERVTGRVQLDWRSVSDPSGVTYDVRVLQGKTKVLERTGLSRSQVEVGLPNGDYRWRVRARDRADNVGPWSDGARFRKR